MRVASSIGKKRYRSKTCKLIRRGKRLYLIDPKNPRNKVRQGSK
ncbi:ribosomal protein bL36 [Holospora obtusa]|nr:ribosomal protein bL36 [Holospora obtusa]